MTPNTDPLAAKQEMEAILQAGHGIVTLQYATGLQQASVSRTRNGGQGAGNATMVNLLTYLRKHPEWLDDRVCSFDALQDAIRDTLPYTQDKSIVIYDKQYVYAEVIQDRTKQALLAGALIPVTEQTVHAWVRKEREPSGMNQHMMYYICHEISKGKEKAIRRLLQDANAAIARVAHEKTDDTPH